MLVEDLVYKLRTHSDPYQTMVEAADKLEELAAENERMRRALEQIEQQLDYGQINMALHITRRALEGGE